MDKEKFLNFPIQLLAGFLVEPQKVLNDIIDYVLYVNSLPLEFGTEIQKMKASAKTYGITLGNCAGALKNGKLLYESIPTKSPKAGINKTMLFDFYSNEKTEFDKVCLLGFLAIKSILGTKSYCKVTNSYLWARMDGKTNTILEVSELSTELRKYANRYQTENIKNELIFNWHLIYYSHFTRGFYVSLKMNLEDLIFEAEKKRKSLKISQQKELQKEALKKAMNRLNNAPP